MPKLEAIYQQLETETGKRVVVRDGWDNATPHVEKMLKSVIKERNDERGWLWTMQPPNSPLTNASKVTTMQGLHNRGLYLTTERLYRS